jgi:hypothetical protein
MNRADLSRRLGYPRVKLRWLRTLAYRKFLDWYRRSEYCRMTGSGMLTPLDAVFRNLELRGLYPDPLIVLEVFGGVGLCKTIDIAPRAAHITHLELHEALVHHAKKMLPNDKTVFVVGDSIRAVNERRLPRQDYNFIHIDNDCGRFGDYFENFDLFPAIADCLGERGCLVFNVQLDIRDKDPEALWLQRRREFFGLAASGDPARIDYATAQRAYLAHIPQDRFAVGDVFPVPHHGETIYMVMSLTRKPRAAPA